MEQLSSTTHPSSEKIWNQSSDVLGGLPVFTGTRVSIRSLFDHLEAGDSLDEFLEGFPSVTRAQAIGLLEHCWQGGVGDIPK